MLVKLLYKQVIDNQSSTEFEKAVWREAYEEFYLQSQRYHAGGTLFTLQAMIANDPKANSLHYKVGFSVGLYLRNLNLLIPNAFDSLGLRQVPFESCDMQILAADTRSNKDFKLALLYTTPPLVLHGLTNSQFWVSFFKVNPTNPWQESIFIIMEPNISIGHVQPSSEKIFNHHDWQNSGAQVSQ